MKAEAFLEAAVPAGPVRRAAVLSKYRRLTRLLIARGLRLSTMESCTGGCLASLLTDTEGSSAAFTGSYVAYSNAQKIRLGVPRETVARFGVYSAETALAMAGVCRVAFGADVGAGVTGSFGNPDPANGDSVPGCVFFAVASAGGRQAFRCLPPPLPSRASCKLTVADTVADCLLGGPWLGAAARP